MTNTNPQSLAFRVNLSNRRVMVRPFPHAELPEGVLAMARVDEPRWAHAPAWLGTVFEYEDGTFGALRGDARELVITVTLRQALMILLGIDNVDEAYSLIGELVARQAELYPPGRSSFIPSRFPFTYAADCLRQYPRLVPDDVNAVERHMRELSRSDAAQLMGQWAEQKGINRSGLAVALAMVFLTAEGIYGEDVKHRIDEVMNRIGEGYADANL